MKMWYILTMRTRVSKHAPLQSETVTEVKQFDWGVRVIIRGLQVSRQDASSALRDAAGGGERK